MNRILREIILFTFILGFVCGCCPCPPKKPELDFPMEFPAATKPRKFSGDTIVDCQIPEGLSPQHAE